MLVFGCFSEKVSSSQYATIAELTEFFFLFKETLGICESMGGHHGKLPPNDLRELCNRTSFDEKELRIWHDKFKKEYPSGSINKQDFIRLYRGFYTSGDAKKFSEHVFRVFDANNDGEIGIPNFQWDT